MATTGRKQPLRRSTRVTKSSDAAESTSNKLSVARNRKRRAQALPEGPVKKRERQDQTKKPPNKRSHEAQPRDLVEEPPKKKKRSHKARPQLEHYRLKKLNLPLGNNAETLREHVQKEFAHLLKCDEPLVANKAQGVDTQRAQVNQVWERRFLEFLIFSKEYGHQHVPKMYVDNPELGRWTVKIRRWKKQKDKNLTKSRLKRLEAAGFLWDPKADPDFWKIQHENEKALDLWEENYNDLLKYKQEHGDCNVPKSFSANERLSRWVSKQRKHYRAKQANAFHSLTDEKEKRLLDIGFIFKTKNSDLLRQLAFKHNEDRWNGFCERLAAFKEEHGHCAVPRRWKKDEQLASWVTRQRVQWKRKQRGEHSYLNDERIEQLREIGFVFAAIDPKIYPGDGCTLGTRSTSELWSKTFTLTGDESDDEEADEDVVYQHDEQRQATAVAPPVKRNTLKIEAKNGTAKKTTRQTRTADEAAGVSPEKEQLRKLSEAQLGKRTPLMSKMDNAPTRSITRTCTTKSSAEQSLKVIYSDETRVSQGKRKSRATDVAPSGKGGTPKIDPKFAAQMTTTRRKRTSDSAEDTLNDEEPDGAAKTKASVSAEKDSNENDSGDSAAQMTTTRRKRTSDSAEDTLNDEEPDGAAKTKTSVLAEKNPNENHSGESVVFQQKEQPSKTVVAPPGGLGIIISNRTKSKGTVVSKVRTASVLSGKILPGDRIIAIDGEDVSLLTASEISKLMAGKTGCEKKLTVINSGTKCKKKKGNATS